MRADRFIGIAMGIGAALALCGVVGNRAASREPPPGPVISECDGALREIVIQYVSGSDAAIPVYREFLSQLDRDVLVDVVCPDQKTFDELRAAVGEVPCQLRPRLVGHAMTAWSRDRWLALGTRGDRVMLLAPASEPGAPTWPARAGDEALAGDLARLDPLHQIVAERSTFTFEGGDFLADDRNVFVTPAVLRRNLQHSAQSTDELVFWLHRALGKPIILLKNPPNHHAGMFMMAAEDGVMLVGDPSLARPLIDDASLSQFPGGPDWSADTQKQFDDVASQVASLGYRVVRIPTVLARDAKTYFTYVNVITDHRDGKKIVYLPVYRGAEQLNVAAINIWRTLGFEVRTVDCTSTYPLFGNLHCLVNVLRRNWIGGVGSRIALPLALLSIAIIAAAVVSYGVHPDLAQFSRGLPVIMIARHLMWPLTAIAIMACLGLLGLVITGKRRAWWLIGLAPVLALFVHRFGPGTAGPADVIDGPVFLDASDRAAPASGDYVVGLLFGDRAYAFPYRALFTKPVVAYTDYDHRMLLMWSAYANRAVAYSLSRELRARDLEVVSTPADSLLVYDRRLGQFICGVTGKLVDGGDPVGFSKELETRKVTWGEWKSRHPDSKVMAADSNAANCPAGPIMPQFKLRVPPVPDAATLITFLGTDPCAAVREDVGFDHPLNLTIGQTRVLLVRDLAGRIRAFDRHLKEDLFLTFEPGRDRKHRDAALSDVDTKSSWTIDGHCIDGQLKGSRLREIDSDEHLYWGVMKHWYPQLELISGGG